MKRFSILIAAFAAAPLAACEQDGYLPGQGVEPIDAENGVAVEAVAAPGAPAGDGANGMEAALDEDRP